MYQSFIFIIDSDIPETLHAESCIEPGTIVALAADDGTIYRGLLVSLREVPDMSRHTLWSATQLDSLKRPHARGGKTP